MPLGGRPVLIHLAMRRFLCKNAACTKVTFAGQAGGPVPGGVAGIRRGPSALPGAPCSRPSAKIADHDEGDLPAPARLPQAAQDRPADAGHLVWADEWLPAAMAVRLFDATVKRVVCGRQYRQVEH